MYDILNMDLATFEFKKNNYFNLIDIPNKSYLLLRDLYFNLLADFALDDQIIKVVECSLFLSMLPLHTENLTKILSFYLKFSSLLEEINNE